MGDDPNRMHTHVMRTMFSHAQCYNIFGPVFFQIKKALSPQWVQPRSLQQLCRKAIRHSLFNGCQNNAHPDTVAELKLPKTLESYICYNTWKPPTPPAIVLPSSPPWPSNPRWFILVRLPYTRTYRIFPQW